MSGAPEVNMDWIILFTGETEDDWEKFSGTYDEAIAEATRDGRHQNYGRAGRFEIIPSREQSAKLERERDQLKAQLAKATAIIESPAGIHAELAALRASQMDEQRAREVLDGWLICGRDDTMVGHHSGVMRLESCRSYTADQLGAVAWWMRNKGAK